MKTLVVSIKNASEILGDFEKALKKPHYSNVIEIKSVSTTES